MFYLEKDQMLEENEHKPLAIPEAIQQQQESQSLPTPSEGPSARAFNAPTSSVAGAVINNITGDALPCLANETPTAYNFQIQHGEQHPAPPPHSPGSGASRHAQPRSDASGPSDQPANAKKRDAADMEGPAAEGPMLTPVREHGGASQPDTEAEPQPAPEAEAGAAAAGTGPGVTDEAHLARLREREDAVLTALKCYPVKKRTKLAQAARTDFADFPGFSPPPAGLAALADVVAAAGRDPLSTVAKGQRPEDDPAPSRPTLTPFVARHLAALGGQGGQRKNQDGASAGRTPMAAPPSRPPQLPSASPADPRAMDTPAAASALRFLSHEHNPPGGREGYMDLDLDLGPGSPNRDAGRRGAGSSLAAQMTTRRAAALNPSLAPPSLKPAAPPPPPPPAKPSRPQYHVAPGQGRRSAFKASIGQPGPKLRQQAPAAPAAAAQGGAATAAKFSATGAATALRALAEAAELATPLEPPAPRYAPDGTEVKHCRCKKSRCLKLYCDCFAAGVFCLGCSCTHCHNTSANATAVESARKAILARCPSAFQPKVLRLGLSPAMPVATAVPMAAAGPTPGILPPPSTGAAAAAAASGVSLASLASLAAAAEMDDDAGAAAAAAPSGSPDGSSDGDQMADDDAQGSGPAAPSAAAADPVAADGAAGLECGEGGIGALDGGGAAAACATGPMAAAGPAAGSASTPGPSTDEALSMIAVAAGITALHKKGCKCKKSRCLKKYCECYQAGIKCSDMCKCESCCNKGPGTSARSNKGGAAAAAATTASPLHDSVVRGRSIPLHEAAARLGSITPGGFGLPQPPSPSLPGSVFNLNLNALFQPPQHPQLGQPPSSAASPLMPWQGPPSGPKAPFALTAPRLPLTSIGPYPNAPNSANGLGAAAALGAVPGAKSAGPSPGPPSGGQGFVGLLPPMVLPNLALPPSAMPPLPLPVPKPETETVASDTAN